MSDKLSNLIEELEREASRIRATQDALVAAHLRAEPSKPEIARAVLFEEGARFLQMLIPHMDKIRGVLSGGRKA